MGGTGGRHGGNEAVEAVDCVMSDGWMHREMGDGISELVQHLFDWMSFSPPPLGEEMLAKVVGNNSFAMKAQRE